MSDLPGGVATGIGSLPGENVVEAVKLVLGELPEFPHLPELPGRGAGADLIGRGAALLVDLPVELYAGRWQLTARQGRDLRRSLDFLERDLDTLGQEAADYRGPLKVSATGPWTLSASLYRQMGGPMLRDTGAVRELAASLAEGVRGHLAALTARLPHANLVLQLDEPSLPAILAGHIPTESGLSVYPPVEDEAARQVLSTVVTSAQVPVVVHCCAADAPVALIASSGAKAISLDLSLLDMDAPAAIDPLGEVLDSGFGLFAGAIPALSVAGGEPEAKAAADLIGRLWSRLGLSRDGLRDQVVVTPACGLAGASPDQVRQVLAACREAARRITE